MSMAASVSPSVRPRSDSCADRVDGRRRPAPGGAASRWRRIGTVRRQARAQAGGPLDAAGRGHDRVGVAGAGLAGGALDRPGHADRGDDSPVGVAHRRAAPTPRPASRSAHALRPSRRPCRRRSSPAPASLPAEPLVERAARRPSARSCAGRGATRATATQTRCVAVAHVELHALAGGVAQRARAPAAAASASGHASAAARPRPTSRSAEREAARRRRAAQAVHLERHRQPVGGGPGSPVAVDQLGQRAAARRSDRVEHGHRLVEHADAAYAVFHTARLLVSHM